MHIKKESVNEIYENAKKRFESLKAPIEPKAMKRFETELSEIASSRSYREGERVSDNDLLKIANEVSLVIGALRQGILDSNNPKEKGADPLNSIMTVTDYLYAMTMQKLGSPELPASFGPAILDHAGKTATAIQSNLKLKQNPYYGRDVYEKQRGKDAVYVREEVNEDLTAVQSGKAAPEQVQRLLVAYQALQKRQNDHGFFWRLFHSDENAQRTELLEQMKASLEGIVGEGADLMKKDSLVVAEGWIRKSVEREVESAFAPDAMRQRLGASPEAFIDADAKQSEGPSTEQLRNSLASDLGMDKNKATQPPYHEKTETLAKNTQIH